MAQIIRVDFLLMAGIEPNIYIIYYTIYLQESGYCVRLDE